MRLLRLVAAVICIVIIFLLFLLPPYLITIHSISCENQFGACDEYLSEKVGNASNKSLKDAKSAIKKTLANEVLVEDYSLQYNFPDKLKLTVLLRKPEFAVKYISQVGYYLVDKDGVIVSKVENTNLPFVELSGEEFKITEKVKDTTLFALLLLNDTFYFHQSKKGIIEGDKLLVDLLDAPRVIFPLSGDRKVLVGSLRLILSRLRGAEEEPRIDSVREIDLRFKNPVLR